MRLMMGYDKGMTPNNTSLHAMIRHRSRITIKIDTYTLQLSVKVYSYINHTCHT